MKKAKLKIKRETLRVLDDESAAAVAGGTVWYTNRNPCIPETLSSRVPCIRNP